MQLLQTRFTLPFAVSLLLVTPSYANDQTPGDQPTLEIFMPPLPDRALIETLARAREIVRAAYADIGVQVLWRSWSSHPSGCLQASGSRQIVFAFGDGRQSSADALAFAKPYEQNGPCVVLLLERLHDEAKRNPTGTGILLGHVLAHEIGHVLQHIARHTETGIMKERWTVRDRMEMGATRLRFTEYDATLIHDAFQSLPTAQVPRRPASNWRSVE